MNTTKKQNSKKGTSKKPINKKTSVVSLMKEAAEIGAKLYKEGKLKPFNRAEIYGTH